MNASVTEIYVGQGVAGGPQANLHAWEIIKSMRERARAAAGDDDAHDYLSHVSEEQARDLDGALESSILRWLGNYKLGPTFFRIEAVSEHPLPCTGAHATFGKPDREVSNLGEVLRAQNKLDDAIAAYRAAIDLQPDYAAAHNNLGNALLAQGNAGDAIAAFRRAAELQPDFATTFFNLGVALVAQCRNDEA